MMSPYGSIGRLAGPSSFVSRFPTHFHMHRRFVDPSLWKEQFHPKVAQNGSVELVFMIPLPPCGRTSDGRIFSFPLEVSSCVAFEKETSDVYGHRLDGPLPFITDRCFLVSQPPMMKIVVGVLQNKASRSF